MSGLRVGIDLDGVCYDFAGSLKAYLMDIGHKSSYGDPMRWEFYEDWGLTLGEFLDHCHAGADAGYVFAVGDPLPSVQEAFERIKTAGHSIHVVTDRSFGQPGTSEAATISWLKRHGLHYDTITFASDKTIARVDVMVDDKPENYHALTAAGVDAYMLTRPWNQHVEGAQRVFDLLHYAEAIGR